VMVSVIFVKNSMPISSRLLNFGMVVLIRINVMHLK
jgi:hypothetical protein